MIKLKKFSKKTNRLIIGLFFGLGLVLPALAQITAEQIAQFSALPIEAQEQLASQYGVDLESLSGGQLPVTEIGATNVGLPVDPMEPLEIAAIAALPPKDLADAIAAALEEKTDADEGLQRYGMQLFDRSVSTFAPVDNAQVPANYIIGPGDSFVVLLFGGENQNFELIVDREGSMNFPRLGPISVAGLQFSEAKELIETRVAEQLIGTTAVVSAGRLRAINIFMTGEVAVAGTYSVSALTTVTQALFVAGGISEIGSLRDIRILRENELIGIFDAYDLLMRGDISGDLRLQSGDVIFVPPVYATATVEGSVRRPAIYELTPGDTVASLVQMAGRYTNRAYIKSVALERFDRNDELPQIINLDLTNPSDNSLELFDGDHLRIPIVGDTFVNGVEVKGAVFRSGRFSYIEGMRVSDLLPSIESHLKFDADLNYALIVSIKNERLDIEVTSFDLGLAIANPDSEDDPLLKPRDEILVFDLPEVDSDEIDVEMATAGSSTAQAAEEVLESANRQDLLAPVIAKLRLQARENEPPQIVSLTGAVKVPGEYPLKEGDRLSQLLSAAGGLAEDAYLNEAELQRVKVDGNGFADIEISNINLTRRFDNEIHNPELQSRDQIFVRAVPDWNPSDTVEISGEVRFPGTYHIGPRETIASVISRAGGLTDLGFPSGIIFTREAAREQQRAQLFDYANEIRENVAVKSLTQEAQSLNYLGISEVIEILTSQDPLGRLTIDAPAILAGEANEDLILQNGDAIHVPPMTTSVSVIGEVRRAGPYRYQEQFRLEDYLDLGAGTTVRADEDAIYVIKADGSVAPVESGLFRFEQNSQISPGDTIVVPVNAEYRDTITYWSTITSIVYQTGIAVAAFVAIL